MVKFNLVFLENNIGCKSNVGVLLSDDLIAKLNIDAPSIIKTHIAALINGGGGGQKTFASAGGTDVSRLNEVVGVVKGLI